MQPLIDSDILLYEIGFAAEAGWQNEGVPPFDYVIELLDTRIKNICAMVGATAPPILFMTGSTNFRTSIAKKVPYKERPGNKPFHYKNIKAYLKAVYDVRTMEGLEADDLMSIEQTNRPLETIICTRDKDLHQVPGWHYGWEIGRQAQFGPLLVQNPGLIQLTQGNKKIEGYGDLFFYSQCLTGDKVDTIPGLPGYGPVKAFETLLGSVDSLDAFNRVREAYRGFYGDSGDEELLEQGQLLWMVRELKDGKPVMWRFPE